MLLQVSEFKHKVTQQLPQLVKELQSLTGRYSPQEADAWESSLPKVAKAFSNNAFDKFHLYFGGQGKLALEYRLPAASSWCDMVLLGKHNNKPSAVIVELKDWQTRSDEPGPVEGLIKRHTGNELHPSDQVRGYVEYCRRFHSTVLDHQADVHGCVLFTRDYFCESYFHSPNDKLTESYPCFTLKPDDISLNLPDYFSNRLTEADENFALDFENGYYKQDRNFCIQIAKQLEEPKISQFELLDGQRKALAECRAAVQSMFNDPKSILNRKILIVKGPPGSGKSVVAARLWSTLLLENYLPEGNVVFTTTSSSQFSNWTSLFGHAADDLSARGVVVKTNEYIPVTTHDIKDFKKRFKVENFDANQWRENLKIFKAVKPPRTPDKHFLISIVDEAHALINPEHTDGRGQYGFAVVAGPQAYHIIRGSMISIFFLDPEQGFRERENTTIANLKEWAKELNVAEIIEISLEGNQFRCAGSVEYIEWLETMLTGRNVNNARKLIPSWMNQVSKKLLTEKNRKLEFKIFDSLFSMENALRDKNDSGNSVRFLASFARKWVSKKTLNPHDLPDLAKDFCIRENNKNWSKTWNYVHRGDDYTHFVQAPPSSRMFNDPLCEVGCTYAVRGFDYDFTGILWLNDLVWRNGEWVVIIENVYETGLSNHTGRAKSARRKYQNNPDAFYQDPDYLALKNQIIQAYRILFTRAMKGVYVWFEDQDTKMAVKNYLQAQTHMS